MTESLLITLAGGGLGFGTVLSFASRGRDSQPLGRIGTTHGMAHSNRFWQDYVRTAGHARGTALLSAELHRSLQASDNVRTLSQGRELCA